MHELAAQLVRAHPWLRDPELECCIVGSTALRIACEERGLANATEPGDLDLAWRLTPDEGRAFLAGQGVEATTTPAAAERGTLGARLSGEGLAGGRIEITTFRGGGASPAERRRNDALHREATIGALFYVLADGTVDDPMDGLRDWRRGVVRACGEPSERLREHPVRGPRYVRKCAETGFVLAARTEDALRLTADELAPRVEGPALALELRHALLSCPSPGFYLHRLHELRWLAPLLPELGALFDGRPAGGVRHHPEISLALHMVLALREAVRICEATDASPEHRIALLACVLCHDLGKGATPAALFPSHPGHEEGGVPLVASLWQRIPGFGDKKLHRLCEVATREHRNLHELRQQRDEHLLEAWEHSYARVRRHFRVLARAVRCDRAGRLETAELGIPPRPTQRTAESPAEVEERIYSDLSELDAVLRAISGAEARRRHGDDAKSLRADLRRARLEALRASGFIERR